MERNEKLPIEVVQEKVAELQGWDLVEEKWLTKKYRFRSYLNGIAFVNEIATLSEDVNHHPFISIDYLVVTIKLSSWAAKGVTELDFHLTEQYDNLYENILGK
ncbi:4a-hydroxytetrahydrobiopterin dehydratase [Caldalkalibacillus mannanilyticus]|uniref:4a-hydroxytetrahydrobiopterin dehydratase n=1 Tax=Caldalkalibacillus mannanilyticus TaxID=1418 RepID=UPI0004684ED7|nr:4a-hydroxytetrahydrobiopterin dehydratase [Caldalkalibacillus mannanilyticus]